MDRASCSTAAIGEGGVRRNNLLHTPDDIKWLSEPLCIMRAQIEAFPATPFDVAERARQGGAKKPPTTGQVGIRCVHCAHLPLADRARGAVSYPQSVRLIHQAVRNFQRFHFPACGMIPVETKQAFQGCRGDGVQSKKDSKEYWVESCRRMGMVDIKDGGGIHFAPPERSSASDGVGLLTADVGATGLGTVGFAPSPLASGEDIHLLAGGSSPNPPKLPNFTAEELEALGTLNTMEGAFTADSPPPVLFGNGPTQASSAPSTHSNEKHPVTVTSTSGDVDEVFLDACDGHSEDDGEYDRPTKMIRSANATPSNTPSPPLSSDNTASVLSGMLSSLWQTQQTSSSSTSTQRPPPIQEQISALNDSTWWDTLRRTGRWMKGALPIPLHLTISEEARELELHQLSEDEKKMIEADILGKDPESEGRDSADFAHLATALSKMEEELKKIPTEQKEALAEAQDRCPELTDVEWKLRFLRSEDYVPRAAAKRMARYWRARVDVFGSEKAFLPITIENSLEEEDLPNFFYIPFRAVPTTDLHGSPVMFGEPWRSAYRYEHLRESYNREAMVRCVWYVINSIITDEPEVAKNGLVSLVSLSNKEYGQGDWRFRRDAAIALFCAPIKIRASHVCHISNVAERWLIPIFLYLMGRTARLRVVVHRESDEDLRGTLCGVGLPPERLPTELGGDVVLDPMKWIADRKAAGL